jgi:hypothetical protein
VSSTAPLPKLADRPFVRLALLSALAATIGYVVGATSPHISPVVAAITALITIRPTFHASIQEALRQTLGVVLGALIAFAALNLIGFSGAALFLAVLAVFLTAHLLRLGEEGAIAVSVTVILVVGPHFNTQAIETRLFGVLLGSLIALVVSYFTRPGTPHGRALDAVLAEGERISRLLTTIGHTLAAGQGEVPLVAAQQWLDEAEDILARTLQTRHAAEDAVTGAGWSPMIGRDEAQAVLSQVRITEAMAVTLLGMCRDLAAAAEHHQPMPAPLASSLSDVFLATAGAVTQQSGTARHHPAEPLADHTGPIPVVSRTRRQATTHVRGLDDTQPLLLGGSLLRDTAAITEILSGHADNQTIRSAQPQRPPAAHTAPDTDFGSDVDFGGGPEPEPV